MNIKLNVNIIATYVHHICMYIVYVFLMAYNSN